MALVKRSGWADGAVVAVEEEGDGQLERAAREEEEGGRQLERAAEEEEEEVRQLEIVADCCWGLQW